MEKGVVVEGNKTLYDLDGDGVIDAMEYRYGMHTCGGAAAAAEGRVICSSFMCTTSCCDSIPFASLQL